MNEQKIDRMMGNVHYYSQQDISKDKLVIMVTHNPELANEYSSRIIDLKDGNLISDSNPITKKDDKKNIVDSFLECLSTIFFSHSEITILFIPKAYELCRNSLLVPSQFSYPCIK